MRRLLTVGILALASAVPVAADTIRLSSGQVVRGRVVRESAETIIIMTEAGTVVLNRKEVLELEKGDGNTIVSLPRTRPGIVECVWQSFVPFYSPLYKSSDPSLGVPLGLASGFLVLRVVYLRMYRVPYIHWQEPGLHQGLYYAATVAFQSRAAANPSALIFQQPEYFYILANAFGFIRLFPAYGYRIGNRFYTKEHLRDQHELAFYRYVGISAIGALASGIYFHFLDGNGESTSGLPDGPQLERAFVRTEDARGLQAGVQFVF